MSIIDTLITDRTAADTAALETLFAKARAGSLTEEEKAILADPAHKGAYNCTDLNRVSEALEYLKAKLEGYGYLANGYSRVKIPHTGGKRLPDGYTEVEYIQSSGTQYVDTGISPTNNTKVCMDFQLVENTNTPTLFGSRNTSTNSMFFVYLETSGNTWYACYGTQWVNFTTSTDSLSRKQLEFGSTGGFIGEESKTWTAQTISSNYPIVLFARNTNGAIGQSAKMHLYSCQIYDNGTLVRDFVPCKNPDGAYGLYDVANSKFYGNSGSGVFTSGAVVDPPVPSDPSDDETRDPFLWYEDDIPTANQMAQYIANVIAIRSVLELLSTTPEAPEDMEGLTAEEANAIEFILIDVQTLINNMVAAWFYSGDLYSGEV